MANNDKIVDIKIGENIRKRKTILDGWDEITERLTLGQTVDLDNFVPDETRNTKKMNAIKKMLEDKQKL